MKRSGLHHVFAYGPKTDTAFLRFFCVVICWGAGGGVGGCNNVLCLRYHRFSSANTLHVTLRTSVLGGGWGGGRCNNVLCLRHHRFSSVNTLHVTLQTSVLGGGWGGGGVQLHPVSTLSSIFFGKHSSCYVAHFCFGRGVGRGEV